MKEIPDLEVAFGRWLRHEAGALMSGISTFRKDT